MLAFVISTMMIASSDQASFQQASPYKGPTLQCREVGSAPSRSQAVIICRTKVQWQKYESCKNVTRYCPPEKRAASLGTETAFPLNEGSRVICRVLKVTGSRLSSVRTCLPQREWQRMYENTQTEMKELQNTFSKKTPF